MTDPLASQSHFVERVFEDLQIAGVVWEGSEFFDCTFKRCVFSESRLTGCRFVDCTFDHCDLSLAQIPESGFTGVRFNTSRLLGVDWTRATWPAGRLGDPLCFVSCQLSMSVFIGLALPEVQFLDCLARGVDFREADLTGANFRGTDLQDGLFLHTNLTRADFSQARNYTIDPSQNTLNRARFALPEALSLLYSLDIELKGEWAG